MVRMRKPLRAYSQAQFEENTLPNRQETQGDRHRACIAAVLQNLLTLLPWLKINTSRVPAFQITAIEGFAGGSSGIAPASRRRDLFRARLKSAEESCAGSVAPRGKNTPLSLPRGAPWCSFHILGREHNGPLISFASGRRYSPSGMFIMSVDRRRIRVAGAAAQNARGVTRGLPECWMLGTLRLG